MILTTSEAGAEIGMSPATVCKICRNHDIGRMIGGARVVEDRDLPKIKKLRGKGGRPRPAVEPVSDEASGHLPPASATEVVTTVAELRAIWDAGAKLYAVMPEGWYSPDGDEWLRFNGDEPGPEFATATIRLVGGPRDGQLAS